MFIVGSASNEEIKTMREQGWNVEEVDVKHFNKALGSDTASNDEQPEPFVAVYVNEDMSALLSSLFLVKAAKEYNS